MTRDEYRPIGDETAEASLEAEAAEQMTDEEAAEAAEIRADIEVTRVEMGDTLSELGDRLEPGHLIHQAKENVRDATIGRVEETARGLSDMVIETIRRNPIPAAMAGAGLALLWMNRSSGSGGNGRYRSYYYGTGYDTRYGTGYRADYETRAAQPREGVGDKVGEAASTVGDTVTGAADRVGYAVGRAGENIGQTAGEVGENVGQTVSQIGHQLDRAMQANPLAMTAVAAGAGAVIGALIPETPQEQQMLGDASRQVGIAVRDAVDEATVRAEEGIDQAEQKITSES
ncbi:MAG TPA: DUF3618 domain-containing protein [Candidatus Limnocylindria bacterium]|nr:DUF3618 domain-containing protein [Candidatus Limnocylindria bacterium]